jgi:plasmid stabilization system protein ParE
MMELKWASKAVSDLDRLYTFLSSVNKRAAAKVVRSLVAAPSKLIEPPRIGENLEEFEPREVRRLLVGPYEMRYEIQNEVIFVLRVWHTRENR